MFLKHKCIRMISDHVSSQKYNIFKYINIENSRFELKYCFTYPFILHFDQKIVPTTVF